MDDTVKVWNTVSGSIVFNSTGHTGAVFTVTTLLNTTYLASGSGDTNIKIWNQATGALVQTISNSRVVSSLTSKNILLI